MRYTITIYNGNDALCIYDTASPVEELALIDPTLHLESDAAGSFEATVPQTNVGWGKNKANTEFLIEKMVTKIKVTFHNALVSKTIWRGRFLSVETDFKNRLKVYAEGAYSFLNDSTQVPHVFDPVNIGSSIGQTILTYILSKHNTNRDNSVRIFCGTVTVPDSAFYDLDNQTGREFALKYENTIESVNRLREQYGGHMRIRYEGDTPYLDWFETYDTTIEPEDISKVEFGVNLMDFTKKLDGTDLANAIFPIGKTIYSSKATAIGEAIPVCSVDSSGHVTTPADGVLATGNGYRIYTNPENGQIDYVEEASYISTGYYDHDENRSAADAKSLQVQPGEIYYVSSLKALAGSTQWIITENPLGTNPAWVLSSKKASTSTEEPSVIDFAKVTVPESQRGFPMFLNVSAFKATGIGYPTWPEQLNMSIYRSRTIPEGVTEPITLLGVAEGVMESTVVELTSAPFDWDTNWKAYYRKNTTFDTYDKISDDTKPTFVANTFYKAQPKSYLDSDNGHTIPNPVSDGSYTYNSVTYTKAAYFVQDDTLIAKYGRIEKIITCSDVTLPEELERLAAHYLYVDQMKEATVNVSALDLALLGNDYEISPDILEPVHILSSPHGTNLIAPLQQREIPFNDLSSQTYEIGYDKSEQISQQLKLGGIK